MSTAQLPPSEANHECQCSGSYPRMAQEASGDQASGSDPPDSESSDTLRSPPLWEVEPSESIAPPGQEATDLRARLDGVWASVDGGLLEQARYEVRALLDVAPRLPEVHILSAVIEEAEGRVVEALQSLRRALMLDPACAEAQLRSSLLMMRALHESELCPAPPDAHTRVMAARISGARRLIRFERARKGRG